MLKRYYYIVQCKNCGKAIQVSGAKDINAVKKKIRENGWKIDRKETTFCCKKCYKNYKKGE